MPSEDDRNMADMGFAGIDPRMLVGILEEEERLHQEKMRAEVESQRLRDVERQQFAKDTGLNDLDNFERWIFRSQREPPPMRESEVTWPSKEPYPAPPEPSLNYGDRDYIIDTIHEAARRHGVSVQDLYNYRGPYASPELDRGTERLAYAVEDLQHPAWGFQGNERGLTWRELMLGLNY